MERPILVLGNCVQGTRMQWKMKDHQANIIKQQFSKENFAKFYFAQMSSVYTLYIYTPADWPKDLQKHNLYILRRSKKDRVCNIKNYYPRKCY